MGLVNDFKRWVSGEVDDDDDFDMDEGPVEESEAREASSHYSYREPGANSCCI